MEQQTQSAGCLRVNWIDSARFFAMILVIAGHHELFAPYGKVWVYSFHMPLFFMLSGLFFKPASFGKPLLKSLVKYLRAYILPYAVAVILMAYVAGWARGAVFGRFGVESYDASWILKSSFFYGNGWGVLWFLPCLFTASVLMAVLCSLVQSEIVRAVIVIALNAAAGLVLPGPLVLQLHEALIALGFMYAGYVLRRYVLDDSLLLKTSLQKNGVVWAAMILLGVIWVFCVAKQLCVNMVWSDYPLYPLTVLAAFGGCFWFLFAAGRLLGKGSHHTMETLGRSSLLIYIIHSLEHNFFPWEQAISVISSRLSLPYHAVSLVLFILRVCGVMVLTLLVLRAKQLLTKLPEVLPKTARGQMICLILFSVILSILFFQPVVGTYNTTAFAFSYRYGFISRGVVGSVLWLLDILLPGSFINYRGAQILSIGMDLFFMVLLLALFACVLRRGEERHRSAAFCLALVLTAFSAPMFLTFENMGKLDSVMAALTAAGTILLIKRKQEWLVPVLAAVCVCVHQGYVLMFANVFLVILFARAMEEESPRMFKKYAGLFAVTLMVSAVLFLYTNFFSQGNGEAIYPKIYETAQALSVDGAVHKQLIEHEILGLNPASEERPYHLFNFTELPVFLILFLPYLLLAARFFMGCIRKAGDVKSRLKYLAFAVGWMTLLPDFLVKIDFGRWMYAFVFYGIVILLYLIAVKDPVAAEEYDGLRQYFAKHRLMLSLLLLYPLILTPFGDIWISRLSMNITILLTGVPEGTYLSLKWF